MIPFALSCARRARGAPLNRASSKGSEADGRGKMSFIEVVLLVRNNE
jgi:hypothetical protein